ncbi:DUF1192 domain-containing protein [Ancylobacter mangrovi]|uniref:DUF1192 domain-containing protein n=1 Tax=Ancylobacter mangrovi TaxID=2972472 RepID=A0A9X2PHM8_9HYPH|nr:DUF1192 domain-containing protein [Ancylobacter mangrovi]MCS0497584.1 DUF1192 domain-containing protein [Ancylobacter mangrovi]MCS0503894.1 DUF1192 domain-containing protein [Ancylobacter mangrovi]
MAIDADDLFGAPPAKKPATHELGTDLSALSEAEIEERIGALQSEIERLRRTLESKRASRTAADTFFKR